MEKVMTCVVCPFGCELRATLGANGEFVSVTGNTCARGKKYAESEITAPVRTLTSTIPIDGAADKRLPVRTDKPIPKDSLKRAMELIKTLRVSAPVKTGDVICSGFMCGDVRLIACKDEPKL